MCGRYTVRSPAAILADYFGLAPLPGMTPRYNVAPGQPVAAVVAQDGARSWRTMRWGLVPHWARSPDIGYRMINARAETLESKPAYREPFERRRCLVPADGFYEWQRLGSSLKQPFYLTRTDERPFAFAGLWDRWRDRAAGTSFESVSIITTTPNEIVAPIHDRMPVMLDSDRAALWIDADSKARELHALLEPYAGAAMQARPVSTLVNRPENDDAACIREERVPHNRSLFD